MGRIIRNTISYGFVTLILAALGFCIYLFLDDLDGPEVTMTPDTGRISPTQEITLKLADAKSGVRSVVVTIHRNNQSLVILDKVFSEPAPVQTTSFNLKNAGLRDGAFELEITARDNSLMSFGKGNGTTRKWNMQLDTQPPKVRIKTTVPALRRGSVTAIAYSVSEDASMTASSSSRPSFSRTACTTASSPSRWTPQKENLRRNCSPGILPGTNPGTGSSSTPGNEISARIPSISATIS